jgi:hypothetical protein
MNEEGRVFSQLMDFLPINVFRRCVDRYPSRYRVRRFSHWDHFLCMAFAQFTYRESLRDIEACLGAIPDKLYHMGFRGGPVARSTLADANENRDWRIYADEPWALELEQTVYALDATVIDLCLSVFPWARFRSTKAGIKLHTLLDLRGNIPAFVWVTNAKTKDERILDLLLPEPGSIYVLDRGYIDFGRLYQIHEARASFVVRARKNLRFSRRYSRPVDRDTGLLCDQTVVLAIQHSAERYPAPLRRVRYRHPENGMRLTFLSNDFQLPALTITELYRQRWQVELFFKWIKQHLRIKAFFGTSFNPVCTQIWIAITVYVLVAIVRKNLGIDRDLYTLLQILSVTLFDKAPLQQALTGSAHTSKDGQIANQCSSSTCNRTLLREHVVLESCTGNRAPTIPITHRLQTRSENRMSSARSFRSLPGRRQHPGQPPSPPRHRHVRRGHAPRQGAGDRRRQGEGPRRPPRRPAGRHPPPRQRARPPRRPPQRPRQRHLPLRRPHGRHPPPGPPGRPARRRRRRRPEARRPAAEEGGRRRRRGCRAQEVG